MGEKRSVYGPTARRHIGRRLAATVRWAGLSQNELARRLSISSATMSSWVSGRTQPSLEMLMAIALMLKVTPDTLLGFDETRHHEHSVERYRSMLMVECARGFAAERAMASKGLAAEKREAFRSADAAMRKAVRNLESQIATLEKKYLPWLEEEVSAKRAPGRREDEA